MMLQQLIDYLQDYISSNMEHSREIAAYRVIVADDAAYPGTNWTYDFYTEIDHAHKVVRIKCKCT